MRLPQIASCCVAAGMAERVFVQSTVPRAFDVVSVNGSQARHKPGPR